MMIQRSRRRSCPEPCLGTGKEPAVWGRLDVGSRLQWNTPLRSFQDQFRVVLYSFTVWLCPVFVGVWLVVPKDGTATEQDLHTNEVRHPAVIVWLLVTFGATAEQCADARTCNLSTEPYSNRSCCGAAPLAQTFDVGALNKFRWGHQSRNVSFWDDVFPRWENKALDVVHRAVSRAAAEQLRPLVLDVGAWIGPYTLTVLSSSPRAYVSAMEPDPVARSHLLSNVHF